MNIIDITLTHPLWDAVWRLYTASFPDHERRLKGSHTLAMSDPRFHAKIAVKEGRLAALMFYWQGDGLLFVEHLAVEPSLRGCGVGSEVLQWLLDRADGQRVFLEIDPSEDEISIRRLRFYENLGFRPNGYPYFHTSYSVGGLVHRLVLMSYPGTISEAVFDDFLCFVRGVVLHYKDGL